MTALKELLVTKRDGRTELIDLEKMHKVLFWATQNIKGVSVSEIELKSHIQFYNKIKTSTIQETLIKTAADLISDETPNYQIVASRLVNFTLRKEVYGTHEPPVLVDHVKKTIALGKYDPEILGLYSDKEWVELNKIINHDRDDLLSYAAIEQFREKYLVQDRTKRIYYETPQMAYILIAAILFSKYPKETRLTYVKDYYDAISRGPKSTITLPTPILGGIRTLTRQFSSCTVIECGDSKDSINATASAIVDYASERAGIGIGAGRIRAKGSSVHNGEKIHTGCVPFYKYFQAGLKSVSQGGIRGASATLYFPIFHLEVEDLIVLKNNKGTDENRVRHMDYGVQINGFFYKRFLENGNITLFSPHEVPDLYEAFFVDQEKFAELYEKYERAYSVRKKTVSAVELFTNILMERNNTGRIYIHNVDHGNDHGAFKASSPVRLSNLCGEIFLSTHPLTEHSRLKNYRYEDFSDINVHEFRAKYGEISLCTLSSINLGAFNSPEEMEYPAELAIRALDELLDYQKYPILAAEVPARNRRSLGVGVCNLAYFLAKNGKKYSDGSANDLVNQYAEALSYYLIKASNQLAIEKGPCKWIHETKYSDGILPIDTYKKAVDNLLTVQNYMDWSSLRESVKKYGMRNSTVMALMPVETSSQLINATNGIEPPRSCISVKGSKDGVFKQVVPEIFKLRNKYEYLWDMPNCKGYLEISSIFQKYVDQAISTNTHYNPTNYENNQVPMSELIKDLIYAYKLGQKFLYYSTTRDGSGEVEIKDEDAEGCISCKL